jgi:hypothetical protein
MKQSPTNLNDRTHRREAHRTHRILLRGVPSATKHECYSAEWLRYEAREIQNFYYFLIFFSVYSVYSHITWALFFDKEV